LDGPLQVMLPIALTVYALYTTPPCNASVDLVYNSSCWNMLKNCNIFLLIMDSRWWKNFEDMYNRLDIIPPCDIQTDRRTDGQTSCDGIVRDMNARRITKTSVSETIDDTKAAARQSPNYIKKTKQNLIRRKTIFNMADVILSPCNVARGSGMTCHWIRQNVRHIGILLLV